MKVHVYGAVGIIRRTRKLFAVESPRRMLLLPLFFHFGAGTGVEIVAARIAGREGFVAVEAHADTVGHTVVRPAHDGEDVHVAGSPGQGAETAVGELNLQGICGGALRVTGHPVVVGLDLVGLVDLLDVGILVFVREKRRRGVLAGHNGDGIGGIAHAGVQFLRHLPVKLLNRLVERKPYGSAHEVHLPAVLCVAADGGRVLHHLPETPAGVFADGPAVPFGMFLQKFLNAGRCHHREHRPVYDADSHILLVLSHTSHFLWRTKQKSHICPPWHRVWVRMKSILCRLP